MTDEEKQKMEDDCARSTETLLDKYLIKLLIKNHCDESDDPEAEFDKILEDWSDECLTIQKKVFESKVKPLMDLMATLLGDSRPIDFNSDCKDLIVKVQQEIGRKYKKDILGIEEIEPEPEIPSISFDDDDDD